jgi:hypothetical protein
MILDLKDKLLKKYHGEDFGKEATFNKDNDKLVKEVLKESATKSIKKISYTSLEIEYTRLLKARTIYP